MNRACVGALAQCERINAMGDDVTINQEVYNTANESAMNFVAEQKKKEGGDLYGTWTQHTGTCGNVCDAFQRSLAEQGVTGGREKSVYLDEFMRKNGIGDNYYS